MTGRRADVAKLRRSHEPSIHKLMPHAVAYSTALYEGDAAACDAALDRLAQILIDDFDLPRGRRVVLAQVEPGKHAND